MIPIEKRYRERAAGLQAEAKRIRLAAIKRRKQLGFADGAYFADLGRAYDIDQLAQDLIDDLDARAVAS